MEEMGEVKQTRQLAAERREELALMISRSLATIERSRALLIELDQVFARSWTSVWLRPRDLR
jgi:hypothetical protein